MTVPAHHSRLSVVIPVYRSEGMLLPLVHRLQPTLAVLVRKHELVLVNDGSPDESWRVIKQLAAQYHWVRGIRLM
jgi:glycosyltransferase involved in cell wall biosynthesis